MSLSPILLEYLDDDPISLADVLAIAKARGMASEGTLNSVRAELARSGQIVQVGRGRAAQWKLGRLESED